MGRHALPDPGPHTGPGPSVPVPPSPAHRSPVPSAPPPPARRELTWRERLVLAVVAATAGGLVVGWANASWVVAGITALVVAALVLVAAWLAGTLPPPPSQR